MSESKWQPDTVAEITYGTERRGGTVRAIRAHGHKGWVFPGSGSQAMFVYDDQVTSVQPLLVERPRWWQRLTEKAAVR